MNVVEKALETIRMEKEAHKLTQAEYQKEVNDSIAFFSGKTIRSFYRVF